MELLKELCEIHAPSGNEVLLKNFLIDYVKTHSANWKVQPEIIHGNDLQDCLILKFGDPRTAVFAHMDSIGFTVRYENQLVPIGGPDVKSGYELIGEDVLGPIECKLEVNDENQLSYKFGRPIKVGTELIFKCNFRETKDYIQSCYLDNRLGIYNTLQLTETLEDGLIVFSCWEEHGGGSVPFLIKYIHENYKIRQALISDITWITDGVKHGEGVVISMRDRNIPRRAFIEKIISKAQSSQIPFQLEVEGSGSSDGREIQLSPYPIDWCFIGAPEDHVHSPNEKVHKQDINAMISLYKILMKEL
ncbi:aminopeptidase [Fulvivirgaceae bacterium BMA10]|uniref:Aminopeptidase n=1 Tax=Splendidivirga corallicola TaxID=3051826 RepID=A0ABT8KIJ6_9BACT|nr:aminopeptidase [Fulvivirgaceae bacterium BMA10]